MDRSFRATPRQITDIAPLSTEGIWQAYDLSPDGTQLAFFGYDENRGAKYGVFVAPTAGSRATLYAEISVADSIVPVWSPDSQWLAYSAGNTLYRISRDGSISEPLATIARWDGWSLRWSPNGQYIAALAYEKAAGEQNAVIVVSVAGKHWIRLTPTAEPNHKEGLEWHPDGHRLTYFYYGPEKYDAKIKWAYLDGRPTEEMIDQDNHWDYVGVWSPDGRQFYFNSEPCQGGGKRLHVYDLETKQITHAVRNGWLPRWSGDGKTAAWADWKAVRSFEVWENFR